MRPNWTFQKTKTYSDHLLREWSDPIQSVNISDVLSGPGENGTAFVPTDEEKPLMLKMYVCRSFVSHIDLFIQRQRERNSKTNLKSFLSY